MLAQGQILTSWASHCDDTPYNGWIMAYNEATLAQTAAINLTPKGAQGGIWDVGGLALDSNGAIYTLLGNGIFDTTLTSGGFPVNQDYGNAAVKLTLSGTALTVADYFTSWNTTQQSIADTDLGSGSPLLLPDQVDSTGTTRHLMVAAGKDTNLYLLDRDNMGKYNGNVNSTDAYYQGLVWALEGATTSPAVLHAYNAANLGVEYYNSNQAANSRDAFGNGNKFVTPVIANGKVFAATPNGVAVFGILH